MAGKSGRSLSVAAIVPVLNESALLPDMIERFRHIDVDELVYADGGSTDGTREQLQAAGVRWVSSRSGRSAQMNCGAAECTSDILLFIHVDTAVSSSHIEAVRKSMRDRGMAGGRFDVQLSGAHPAFRIIESMINLRSRLSRISTGDQAMFVRRDVFERLGGFPDQPLLEDVAFSRLLKRAGNIACLRQRVETSSRRWEEYGIVRTILLMWWLRLRFWLGAAPARLHYE